MRTSLFLRARECVPPPCGSAERQSGVRGQCWPGRAGRSQAPGAATPPSAASGPPTITSGFSKAAASQQRTAVRRRADEVELVLEQAAQSFGNETVVVGQQHRGPPHRRATATGRSKVSAVPFPGSDEMVKLPPRRRTRSSIG